MDVNHCSCYILLFALRQVKVSCLFILLIFQTIVSLFLCRTGQWELMAVFGLISGIATGFLTWLPVFYIVYSRQDFLKRPASVGIDSAVTNTSSPVVVADVQEPPKSPDAFSVESVISDNMTNVPENSTEFGMTSQSLFTTPPPKPDRHPDLVSVSQRFAKNNDFVKKSTGPSSSTMTDGNVFFNLSFFIQFFLIVALSFSTGP